MGKQPHKSKTIVINVIVAAISVIGLVTGQADAFGYELPAYVATVLSLLNVALRFVTGQPITLQEIEEAAA